jgi:hypothetical protein
VDRIMASMRSRAAAANPSDIAFRLIASFTSDVVREILIKNDARLRALEKVLQAASHMGDIECETSEPARTVLATPPVKSARRSGIL